MQRLDISLNWDLPRYSALNGFHMIMATLSKVNSDKIFLGSDNWLDRVNTELVVGDLLNINNNHHGNEIQIGFESWQDEVEENSFSDINFHHTKIPNSTKSYIQHFESIETLAFPFVHFGKELEISQKDYALTSYNKLALDNCVGIWTHLNESAENLKIITGNRLNKKLYVFDVGLADSDLTIPPSKFEHMSFYFGSSQSRNPDSFLLRGGFASLKVALGCINAHSNVHFYFHCPRPEPEELYKMGFTDIEMKLLEHENIIWIQEYLSVEEQRLLLAQCDYMLLPSIDMHVRSLISALAAGTVPVILPLKGNLEMVSELFDIPTVDLDISEFSFFDENLGFDRISYNKYVENQELIVTKLLNKVSYLISRGRQTEQFKIVREYALTRWSQEKFVYNFSHFASESKKRLVRNLKSSKSRFGVLPISEKHFGFKPTPTLIWKLGNRNIYKYRDIFFSDGFEISKKMDELLQQIRNNIENVKKINKLLFNFLSKIFPETAFKYKIFLLNAPLHIIFKKFPNYGLRVFSKLFKRNI